MPTVLDLPEVRASVHRFTVPEFEHLGELGVVPPNAELIRGLVVVPMAKSPLHRKFAKRLYDQSLRLTPAGFVVYQGAPLRLGDSMPEPDLMIVPGSEADFDAAHPTTAALVIEVAVTTASLDRANASLYAEGGVEEYWIVLGAEQAVEIYRDPSRGQFRLKQRVSTSEALPCGSVPGLVLSLAELFPGG